MIVTMMTGRDAVVADLSRMEALVSSYGATFVCEDSTNFQAFDENAGRIVHFGAARNEQYALLPTVANKGELVIRLDSDESPSVTCIKDMLAMEQRLRYVSEGKKSNKVTQGVLWPTIDIARWGARDKEQVLGTSSHVRGVFLKNSSFHELLTWADDVHEQIATTEDGIRWTPITSTFTGNVPIMHSGYIGEGTIQMQRKIEKYAAIAALGIFTQGVKGINAKRLFTLISVCSSVNPEPYPTDLNIEQLAELVLHRVYGVSLDSVAATYTAVDVSCAHTPTAMHPDVLAAFMEKDWLYRCQQWQLHNDRSTPVGTHKADLAYAVLANIGVPNA
jgi:hypothetical protein